MEIINAGQNLPSDDSAWYVLADFPLSEFLADQDRSADSTTGVLFQTVRALGMPPERVEDIAMMLVAFATQALEHFKQGKIETPGRVRVFCQRKLITNGGWGFFLIERRETSSAGSAERLWNFVDLYLYEEGE